MAQKDGHERSTHHRREWGGAPQSGVGRSITGQFLTKGVLSCTHMLTQNHGRIWDCAVKGSTTYVWAVLYFGGSFPPYINHVICSCRQYLRARDVPVLVSIGEGFLAKVRSTHEGGDEKPARAAQAALPRALRYPYHRA